MLTRNGKFIVLIFISFLLTGCVAAQKKVTDTILPKHDDVLIYDLSFDRTYLRALEILQTHPEWEVETTDKEKGIIRVYNLAFFKATDADERHITFLVKRLDRDKTSIEIIPEDQAVLGGEALLEKLGQGLSQQY